MLSAVQEDGTTLREHLENDYRQKLMWNPECPMPDELVPVECPECMVYLWEYFQEMGLRRTNNGFTKSAIGELELEAWQRRKKIQFEQFEFRAMDALEATYLIHQQKQTKKDSE